MGAWMLQTAAFIEYAPSQPRWGKGDPRGGQFMAVGERKQPKRGMEMVSWPVPKPVADYVQSIRRYLWSQGIVTPEIDIRQASDAEIRAATTDTGVHARAYATLGMVVFNRSDMRSIVNNARVARNPRYAERLREFDTNMTRVIIHELLHQARGISIMTGDPVTFEQMRTTEEGIVEAVAMDLYWDFWKRRKFTSSSLAGNADTYKDQVVEVRKRSGRATGGSWTAPSAASWRKQLLLADAATRLAMWEAAGA